MDSVMLNYITGEEVHAGDRVQYDGIYGTVVFVSDGEVEQFVPGYDDHSGSGRGVVVRDDDGVITNLGEPDLRLVFIERG
jgi:hypothetical protein